MVEFAGKEFATDIVADLRDNPEKYQELRTRVQLANTDEDRAKALIDFVTSDDRLREISPESDSAVLSHATITTTTVFI